MKHDNVHVEHYAIMDVYDSWIMRIVDYDSFKLIKFNYEWKANVWKDLQFLAWMAVVFLCSLFFPKKFS